MITKLIRDFIPQIVEKEKRGQRVSIYTCDEKEYYARLREKLQEEVNEFLHDDTTEELADILGVVYALAQTKNVSQQELETTRVKKSQERGGFSKRLVGMFEG